MLFDTDEVEINGELDCDENDGFKIRCGILDLNGCPWIGGKMIGEISFILFWEKDEDVNNEDCDSVDNTLEKE